MSIIHVPTPMGALPVSACKEKISRAYVEAVAAVARCTVLEQDVDYEGIDLEIQQSANHLRYSEARLGIQLKASSQNLVNAAGTHIAFSGLERTRFDKLRDPQVYVPRILVVLLLPLDPLEWIYQNDRMMIVRRCAYWVSLRGLPAISSKTTTAHVPLSQPFTVDELTLMLRRIGNGGEP